MSIVQELCWIVGVPLLLMTTVVIVMLVGDCHKYKKEIAKLDAETKRLKEEATRTEAARIKAQTQEFESWIEATRDKCEVCGGNHCENDCPDVPGTDLFASEVIKRKRELRQFQESLKTELPEDHPKRNKGG